MLIRKYKTKDKEQVKKLVKNVLKEIFGSAKNLSDLDNINKNYQLFLIAEDKGKIIGTLGIKNEGDARISRMYVKKENRGKGIGKALMKRALNHCKKKFKRVFLSTYPQMDSESFYKKMGFKIYKKDERIWMEKII
jgi:putative acetyltransferase